MANTDSNAAQFLFPNPHSRPQSLFSLSAMSNVPRPGGPDSDVCRLVIDSRVFWALEPVDSDVAWLYLPAAAHVRRLADCLVLTMAD